MSDLWTLTRNLSAGDYVQYWGPLGMAPYLGKVAQVLPSGQVDVLWPFGKRRLRIEDVVEVTPRFASYVPPALGVKTPFETGRKTAASSSSARWSTKLPPSFFVDLASGFHRGAGQILAYDTVWKKYHASHSDKAIRDEVAKFYAFASNSVDMYLNSWLPKFESRTAIYWANQNRQHRATRGEVQGGCPNCPKCGGKMRKATYKMQEGTRQRLFACPTDLYLIKQSDILGPEGQVIEW